LNEVPTGPLSTTIVAWLAAGVAPELEPLPLLELLPELLLELLLEEPPELAEFDDEPPQSARQRVARARSGIRMRRNVMELASGSRRDAYWIDSIDTPAGTVSVR
jgi:hypothetical protein